MESTVALYWVSSGLDSSAYPLRHRWTDTVPCCAPRNDRREERRLCAEDRTLRKEREEAEAALLSDCHSLRKKNKARGWENQGSMRLQKRNILQNSTLDPPNGKVLKNQDRKQTLKVMSKSNLLCVCVHVCVFVHPLHNAYQTSM